MNLTRIKSAIEGLDEEEKAVLITWLVSRDRKAWDEQIAEDFSPGGRGAKLLEDVDSAIDRGDFKPLG